MDRKRELMWAILWLLLATGAVFSRLVQYPTDILTGPQDNGLNDVTRQVIAYRTLLPSSFHQSGHIALWNPWAMGGTPWLGNPQSGVLYPPNWLYFLLPETVCVNWLAFFHHWWAGFGIYLLARTFGFQVVPSIGAGICFLGAPYLLAQTGEGHISQVCLISWAPWLWLAYERIRAGQAWGITSAAIVLSLTFVCDHVQELFYLVLMFSAFSIWDAGNHLRDVRPIKYWRIPLGWGLAGILAIGLVAVELVPISAYHRQAARAAGVTVADASTGSLRLLNTWQLLDPLAFAGPENSVARNSVGLGSYWESLLCFGVGPLTLAFWAFIAARGIYPRGRLICVVLLTVLFSFGDATPLFPFLHRWMPGIGMFRAPMRALFHASFAMSILAAIGLEHSWRLAIGPDNIMRRRGLLFWKCMAILAILGMTLAWQNLGPFQRGPADIWPQINWIRSFQYLLAVSTSLCLLWYSPRYSLLWMGLSLLVCTIELSQHARAITASIPLNSWRQSNPILDRVAKDVGEGRLMAPQLLVSDRESQQRQISKVEAYEPVPLLRWGQFLAVACPNTDPALVLTGFDPQKLTKYRKALLDVLGVKYSAVLGHEQVTPAGWEIVEHGSLPQETALRGQTPRQIKYTLLRNQTPQARVWLSGHAQIVKSADESLAALKKLTAPGQVIIEANAQQLPPAILKGPAEGVGRLRFTRVSPQKIVASVDLKRDGVLVFSELRVPGWKAIVDGQAAPLYPINYAFQGVVLTPGKHEVEFAFLPPGISLGYGISGFTGFVWLLAAFNAWRMSRSKTGG